MKYYSITRSDDIKIVGRYPQTNFRKGYNPKLNGCFNVEENTFPDFVPNLELELHPKSLITDYLYVINLPFGIIINEKMKSIFSNFKLPRHHFYKVKVYHKDIILKYYWFHYIIDDFWNFLSKENSYGEVKKMINSVKYIVNKQVKIISKEQIVKEKYQLKGTDLLTVGKISMNKEFPMYDFYRLDCLSYNTVISENLKKALEGNNITGMEITPFERFEVSCS